MQFPEYRARRLRRTPALRALVEETRLETRQLVYPLFCVPGKGVQKEIPSMPGQHNLSVDKAVESAPIFRSQAEAFFGLSCPL